MRYSFNPRTHAGCDERKDILLSRNRVSIHAPTQGATMMRNPKYLPNKFQSTHPRRVRPHNLSREWKSTMFQSTHPRRVRLRLRTLKRTRGSFNPRTHAGCDIFLKITTATNRSFNPRTHAGCDKQGSIYQ